MENGRFLAGLLFVLTVLSYATLTAGQTSVPLLINYQGELKSPITGKPVPDGSYDMVFEIFNKETTGVSLWRGKHTDSNSNPVEVRNGIFNVILGSGAGNAMDASVFKESDRWLEMSIERETLSPRHRITSAAYSLVSENSRLLGGKEPSEYVIQAQGLRLQLTGASPNIIAGHGDNAVNAGVVGATIGGGGESGAANRVTDDYSTIGGGTLNQAGDNAGTTGDAYCATVGGGYGNTASDRYATVGGGQVNTASGHTAVVGGGYQNTVSGDDATVGGGRYNTASGEYATVSGGESNEASANSATVGGGAYNVASAGDATVGGGRYNTASGSYATVGGGHFNTASGVQSTVSGGSNNEAGGRAAMVSGGYWNDATGDYSFSAGRRAKAYHDGCFVWGDSYDGEVASGAVNQFIVRASGGVWFYSNTGLTAGVKLNAGGGSWSSISDRALKDNPAPADGKEVLQQLMSVPISTWNYIAQDASVRHIGPMAQDFHAAFGLGEDDKHISTVDADGVALAAIQGLHKLVQEKDAEISSLKSRIETLEDLVEKLVESQAGGE